MEADEAVNDLDEICGSELPSESESCIVVASRAVENEVLSSSGVVRFEFWGGPDSGNLTYLQIQDKADPDP